MIRKEYFEAAYDSNSKAYESISMLLNYFLTADVKTNFAVAQEIHKVLNALNKFGRNMHLIEIDE